MNISLKKSRETHTHLGCRVETVSQYNAQTGRCDQHITLSTPEKIQRQYDEAQFDTVVSFGRRRRLS